jgi:hypothetical protein
MNHSRFNVYAANWANPSLAFFGVTPGGLLNLEFGAALGNGMRQ